METALRNRKERAYSTAAPVIRVEQRAVHLGSSPHAVAWDPVGDRLLYHRATWHYTVLEGTEEIQDYGFVETAICWLSRDELPLNSVDQGQVLAVIDKEVVAQEQSWSGDVTVEVIAVDSDSGAVLGYWHRESEFPLNTMLATFGPSGGTRPSVSFSQPADGTPPWWVPHAIAHKEAIWAIERDGTFHDDGPATGWIVRRSFGTPGTLIHTWSPQDQFVFPHSLALSPTSNTLFVLCTKLFDDLDIMRSYLILLDSRDLSFLAQHELTFGLPEGIRPYRMGIWYSAGGPNTGGLFIREPDGHFVSSAETPEGYDTQDPLAPIPFALFRWSGIGSGTFVANVGQDLPIPLHHMPPGQVLAAWSSSLPEVSAL